MNIPWALICFNLYLYFRSQSKCILPSSVNWICFAVYVRPCGFMAHIDMSVTVICFASPNILEKRIIVKTKYVVHTFAKRSRYFADCYAFQCGNRFCDSQLHQKPLSLRHQFGLILINQF